MSARKDSISGAGGGGGGWPLGLEPVHLKKRVLDTVAEEHQDPAITAKISTTSYSDETSNLETESSCSSKFFPEDKPVTLGEILGMSLNHLATNSFRSIELHVTDSSSSVLGRSRSSSWSSMMRCRCSRASTASSRFDDGAAETVIPNRIYTNSIFEEEHDVIDQGGGGEAETTTHQHKPGPVSLLDHFRSSSSTPRPLHGTSENPLFLVDFGTRQLRRR